MIEQGFHCHARECTGGGKHNSMNCAFFEIFVHVFMSFGHIFELQVL